MVVALACTAILYYGVGAGWGAPHATAENRVNSWGVDDETPLGPLAEVRGIFRPAPEANPGYALGYALMTAATYAPYLGLLVVTGGLDSPTQQYPYGLRDPERSLKVLSWHAHALSTLLGALAVVSIYLALRAVADVGTAALGASLAFLTHPTAYYARTGNVDMAVLAFMAAALACYMWIVVHGFTRPRLLLLAIFAALALATKESAAGLLAVAVLLPVALAIRRDERDVWRPAAWATVAGLLCYGLFSGLFLDPSRYVRHVQWLTGQVDRLATGEALPTGTFDRSLSGHWGYIGSFADYLGSAMTWPGLALALGGIVYVLVSRSRTHWLLWPVIGYTLFMFLVLRSLQLRYVMPSAVLLTPFVAIAIARLWKARAPWVRALALAGLLAVGGVNLLRSVDLTHAMLFDSRYAAADWLGQRLEPGDTVEFFGANQKLPPMEPGVVSLPATEFQGMFRAGPRDQAVARDLVVSWRAEPPRALIVMPDHSSLPGEPYDNSFPPVLWDWLHDGSAGFELAASIRTPALIPWVRRPSLDYPTVNPPIAIFVPTARLSAPR